MSVASEQENTSQSTRAFPRETRRGLRAIRKVIGGKFEEILQLLEEHPDGFTMRLPFNRLHFINDPAAVETLLVKNHKYYHRGPGSEALTRLMGNSVLTVEEPEHLRQRRIIQPAFHKERINSFGDTMVQFGLDRMESWADGQRLDMCQEMMEVSMDIITRTMFSTRVADDVEKVNKAISIALRNSDRYIIPALGRAMDRIPYLRSTREIEAALVLLDEVVYRFIREHRESTEDSGDLLSMLLSARYDDGSGMTDQQLRDETITLFLAGYETTAVALTWTWYLLAQNPEIEARFHEELDAVLEDGRPPTVEDMGRLDYCRRVFTESMRVFPPVPLLAREAIEDNDLGLIQLKRGDVAIISQMCMHHSPRWYQEPSTFDPDRWLPEATASRPKFSYFPFGGGARKCIGEPLSWMEGILLLATIGRHWKFRLEPDAKIALKVAITMRPKYGMPMVAHRR